MPIAGPSWLSPFARSSALRFDERRDGRLRRRPLEGVADAAEEAGDDEMPDLEPVGEHEPEGDRGTDRRECVGSDHDRASREPIGRA